MKRVQLVVLSAFAAAFLGFGASAQQGTQNQQQGGNAVPIEIYGCNFRDGMGLADLEPLHDRYNNILDRNDFSDVASFILTPIFRHASDGYDFLYMERWANGAAMGTGNALKRSERFQDLLADWGEIVECPTHSYYVGMLAAPPSSDRNEAEEAPFQTLTCRLNDGVAMGAAMQALSAYAESEMQSASGSRNGHAIWLPAAGEDPDADFNFKWIILFPSYEHFGASFDNLWNRGGAANMFSKIGPVMNCAGAATRTYNQRFIRRMG